MTFDIESRIRRLEELAAQHEEKIAALAGDVAETVTGEDPQVLKQHLIDIAEKAAAEAAEAAVKAVAAQI